MKIVLVVHVFLPGHSAGTEVLAFNAAKELQRQGHEVEVCTGYMAAPGLADFQRFDTYDCEGINVNRFYHSLEPMGGQDNVVEAEYNNVFYARWFRIYLACFNPDVVHYFHLGLLSASTIDVCNDLSIAAVMTPTDFWLICPNAQLRLPDNSLCTGPDEKSVNCIKHAVSSTQPQLVAAIFNRLPDWLVAMMIGCVNKGFFPTVKFAPMVRALSQRASFLRLRMNKLDKMIVPSRLMGEMLVKHGLDPVKIVFSRYGLHAAPVQAHVPDPLSVLRVGFIGGISEHKGAHLLISAVRLLSEYVSCNLKVYGKTDVDLKYFERLKQLASGDARISFCGTFPNEAIGKIFSELDVLVVPSIWYENTPLVIYSAQAAGCPVIASNLGGMAEVVQHEQNGLLFEVGDVVGLAATLERLAHDRALLQRLAANAVKPKAMEDYVMELIDIYTDVLKVRRR